MGRRVIGMGVLYAGFLWLYAECAELKSKLTLKSAECEFYKTLLGAVLDAEGKETDSKKKEKDK